MTLSTLAIIDVEIFLAAFAMLLLLFSATPVTSINSFRNIRYLAGVGMFCVLGLLMVANTSLSSAFNGLYISNGITYFAKMLATVGTIVGLMYFASMMRQTNKLVGEGLVLMYLALLGLCIMVSAGHFLTLYLGLELMSFTLYILTAFNRNQAKSSEAALKYFILGGLASSILLYGISLLYGFAGSLLFTDVLTALTTTQPALALVGSVLVVIGLLFKLSIVPFHMWTPDVYEGAPTPVTAYMATVGKVAAGILLLRLMLDVFAPLQAQIMPIFFALAALTMLLGAFVAILQTSLKRLFAYSSITHVGFILAGIATGTLEGYAAVLFYLVAYLVTTLGAFGVLLLARYRGVYLEKLEDFKGLAASAPALAGCMLIFMFSLAGVPPLVGFFAKLSIFTSLIEMGAIWLALIGVAASIIALYYSLRLIKIMYFDAPKNNQALRLDPASSNPFLFAIVIVLAAATLYFGIFPDDIMHYATAAL